MAYMSFSSSASVFTGRESIFSSSFVDKKRALTIKVISDYYKDDIGAAYMVIPDGGDSILLKGDELKPYLDGKLDEFRSLSKLKK